jgi:hypothetical protein
MQGAIEARTVASGFHYRYLWILLRYRHQLAVDAGSAPLDIIDKIEVEDERCEGVQCTR